MARFHRCLVKLGRAWLIAIVALLVGVINVPAYDFGGYSAQKLIGRRGDMPQYVLARSGTLPLQVIGMGQPTYLYSINISATNTGTALTDTVIFASVDNDLLATNEFIQTDALDTNAEEGSTARAYLPRESKLGIYLPSLAANETRIISYQLGYSPVQTDFYLVVGTEGCITTPDGSLSPTTNDFEVEWKGYYDATKTGDLVAKGAEYGLIATAAGTIKAFVGAGAGTNSDIDPDSAGTYSAWSLTGASTQWEALSDDDDGTYISAGNSPTKRSSVNIASPSSIAGLAGAQITSVDVYVRAYTTPNDYGPVYVVPFLYLDATEQQGSSITLTGSATTTSRTITRPGGGSWSIGDLGNLEVGVLNSASSYPSETAVVTEVYVRVNYTPAGSASVSDTVASGIHTFKMTRTSTTLELFTDDVSQGTTTVSDPTNQTSLLTSCYNGPAVYTEYVELTIQPTGVVLWYQPIAYISGTTIPDRSAGGTNTGTAIWGSDTPNSSVTVSVAGMESATQLDIAGEVRGEPEAIGVMEESADYFITEEPTNVPFYDIFLGITGINPDLGLSTRWLIIPPFLLITLLLGFLAFKGTGQLWLSAGVMTVILAAGVPMQLFDMWIPLIFGIMAFAVVLVKAWVFQ